MRTRLLLAGLAAGPLLASGCKHCCGDRLFGSRLFGRDRGVAPSRLDPPTRPSGIPPTSIPTVPPSSAPSLPPPDLPDSRSSFRLGDPVQPPDQFIQQAGGTEPHRPATPPAAVPPPSEILLPDPLPGAAPGSVVPAAPAQPQTRYRLGEPIRPDEPPATTDRVAEKPADELPPRPMGAEATGPRTPPAGFARVAGRDGQATGRVPAGGELDWLAASGFRTIVLLHDPSASVADFTAQAERRTLRVVPVPVDLADLGPAYSAFERAVADKGGRPVYVADADPARAGALWYALFRRQEQAGDEVARLRANGLGLAADKSPAWAAVQQFLARP